jgi:hypothetical protein
VFVHAVFEGLAAVDEDDGDFVGELAAQLVVRVYVDFLQIESAPSMEFGQSLLYNFAQVAAFARVNYNLTEG